MTKTTSSSRCRPCRWLGAFEFWSLAIVSARPGLRLGERDRCGLHGYVGHDNEERRLIVNRIIIGLGQGYRISCFGFKSVAMLKAQPFSVTWP